VHLAQRVQVCQALQHAPQHGSQSVSEREAEQ
jgi:hypothetical protein